MVTSEFHRTDSAIVVFFLGITSKLIGILQKRRRAPDANFLDNKNFFLAGEAL